LNKYHLRINNTIIQLDFDPNLSKGDTTIVNGTEYIVDEKCCIISLLDDITFDSNDIIDAEGGCHVVYYLVKLGNV
jgi:hypothetical protein